MPRSCSIVMATYDGRDRDILSRVLLSIAQQHTGVEVIVVNTGSLEVPDICEHQVTISHPLPPGTNPARARNVGMKHAHGDVLILQSDDVVHMSEGSIEVLADIGEYESRLAMVYELNDRGNTWRVLCGQTRPQALFFLGSIHRSVACRIGGYHEDWPGLGYDDNWFEDCLRSRIGFILVESIVGLHLYHERPTNLQDDYRKSLARYIALRESACFVGGEPWPFEKGKSVMEMTCNDS